MKSILTVAVSVALAAMTVSCGSSGNQKSDAETEEKEVDVPAFSADSASPTRRLSVPSAQE